MKFSVDHAVLNGAIATVAQACDPKSSHAVLGGIAIKADRGSGRVSVRAYDLAIGLATSFPAEVEESGETVIPGKLGKDIIAKLPDGQVNFVLSQTVIPVETDDGGKLAKTGYQVKVSVKRSSYKIAAMDPALFTAFPDLGESEQFVVPTALLNPDSVLFAVSKDETKQILCGVHLTRKADEFEFAATDGHRLAVATYPAPEPQSGEDSPEPFATTIPGRALSIYRRIAGTLKQSDTETPDTLLTLGRGVVQFELGDTMLVARTTDGQYPAYQQLIPRQFDRIMTIECKPLLEALSRISEIANDRANKIVKFELADGELEVMAECPDVGTGAEGFDVQYSGSPITICFNGEYLKDSLRNLTTEQVQFEMNTPTSPIILTPLGGDKIKHLVMPVQVRS